MATSSRDFETERFLRNLERAPGALKYIFLPVGGEPKGGYGIISKRLEMMGEGITVEREYIVTAREYGVQDKTTIYVCYGTDDVRPFILGPNESNDLYSYESLLTPGVSENEPADPTAGEIDFKRLLPEPTNLPSDFGKVAALNSAGNRYELVEQTGGSGGGGGLTRVSTDSTISGIGTTRSPLKVVNPFSSAEKTKLASLQNFVLEDDAVDDDKLSDDVVERLLPAPTDSSSDAGKVAALNSDGDGYELITSVSSVSTDATIGGNGTSSSPLSVANPFTAADETKLDNLSEDAIEEVVTDATLTGKGTAKDVLKVAEPYTAAERTKLAGLKNFVLADNAVDDDKLSDDVVERLLPNPTDSSSDSGKVAALNSDGDAYELISLPEPADGGLASVSTDSTITGNGTTSSPLKVANPFTDADETKLDNLSEDAIEEVVTDATLTGKGITGDTLKVANPFTAADETKLDGIATGAIAEVVSDSTLTGAGTAGDTLKVAIPFSQSEKTKLAGLSEDAIEEVVTDATLTGKGISGDALKVAEPYTAAERTKLAGLKNFVLADNAVDDDKLSDDVVERLLPAPTDASSDSGKVAALNSDGDAYELISLPEPADGGLAAVSSDSTLTGIGTTTSPLKVANPFTAADETKLDNLSEDAIEEVVTDSTLTGKGITGDVLKVANPFTAADETKLDGIATGAIAEVVSDGTLTGKGISGDTLKVANPFTAAEKTKLSGLQNYVLADNAVNDEKLSDDVVERLLPNPTDSSSDSGKVAALNSDGDAYELISLPEPADGGLASVSTDSTITGNGTSTSPLKVANPFTAADETKLDNLSEDAIEEVVTDASLTGKGITGDTLKVANPFTDADETKLDGIAAGAIAEVVSDGTLTGKGISGDTLKVANPFTAADETKLDSLSEDAIEEVVSDSTLTGKGITGDVLKVAEPYTAAERTKLAGLKNFVLADNAVDDDKLADDVVERLLPNPTDSSSDSGKVAALNSAGTAYELVAQTAAGLSTVSTDSTIDGDGSSSSPLSVAIPFTQSEKTKLANLSSSGGGALSDVEYVTVGSSTTISATYANVLTSAQTTALPGVFYLEVKSTVGVRSLYEVYAIRDSELSSELTLQFAHSSQSSLKVRINSGQLQVQTSGTQISSGTVQIYIARAPQGLKGDKGDPGSDASVPTDRLLPDPTDDSDDAGKVAALNSDGSAYELVAQSAGGLSTVSTDSTISGNGSSTSPLSVANPFTAADETKLDNLSEDAIEEVVTDSTLTGKGITGDTLKVANPFTAADETKLDNLSEDAIEEVVSDSTLTGKGITGDVLKVANPFTAAEKTKLSGLQNYVLADNAVDDDKLADDVVERLLPAPTDASSDSGKVPALNSAGSAYELVEQSSGGLTTVNTDSTITGNGTTSSPLKVAIPYTQAEKTKLANLSTSGGGTLGDVEYSTVGSSVSISSSYTNILSSAQTTALPDSFYLEITGTVGARTLYDVFPVRKAALSTNVQYQFAHASNVSLNVRINSGQLQVQTTTNITSASALVYIARAARGQKGEPGSDASVPTDRLLPDPTDSSSDAGKVAALNSTGTAYELVAQSGSGGGGDTSLPPKVASLLRPAANLNNKAFDLESGTHFDGSDYDAATASTGGLYFGSTGFGTTPLTLTQLAALAANQWSATSDSPQLVAHVRIPKAAQVERYRLQVYVDSSRSFRFTVSLNSYNYVGEQGSWKYYHSDVFWPRQTSDEAINEVRLEVLKSSRVTGTSTFKGNLVKEKVYAPVKQIIKAGSNVTVTASDSDGTLTIASTASGGSPGSVGAGSIGTTQLANNAVTTAKIANGAVTNAKLGSNSVGGPQIVNSAISGPKIRNGAVTLDKMAANSVGTTQIVNGAVTSGKMATNSIGTSQLLNGAVTLNKMRGNSVGTTQLVDDSVTLDKMASNSVGASQLAKNAVTADKIANGSVTNAKLTVNSIGGPQLVNGAVSDAKLRSNAVTTAKIANDAVTVDKIADAVIKRLLPATLGTAGQILQVNSAANGVEYAAAPSGGGGGGGWTLANTFTFSTTSFGSQDWTWARAINANALIMLLFRNADATNYLGTIDYVFQRNQLKRGTTTINFTGSSNTFTISNRGRTLRVKPSALGTSVRNLDVFYQNLS